MRISDLDKRRAIKRLPEFKKEHARYSKLKTEEEINQFKAHFFVKWKYEFEAILLADEVANTGRKDTPTVEPYLMIYEGEEKTPSLNVDKSVYLKINLKGKTMAQLVEDFKRVIKPYKDLLDAEIPIETHKKRNRKSDSVKDVWAVYDLFQKNDEDISKTADLYEEDYERFYDERQHHVKRLKVAIDNAKEIIASVRKDYFLK